MTPRERADDERGDDEADPVAGHDAQEPLPKLAASAVVHG